MLRGLVVGLKTLLLFMILYTSPAHGQQNEEAVLQEYIRILELEQFSRYSNQVSKPVLKPRVKPQHIRIPREKPVHPLTTHSDLYGYVIHPWDFNRKRTIKCYSVGVDKYGWIVKIPCKETKVKKQSQ
jgi:hypothetical protein